MSKGSKVIPIRIPKTQLSEITKRIEEVNIRTRGELYTLSSFVRKAIDEKLDHYRRGGKKCP